MITRTGHVDLHLHSACSDGSDPPETVVERADSLGFAALAITDHDTVAGVERGEETARGLGLGYLCGVEISAQFGKNEVHIVGLGINPRDAILCGTLEEMRQARARRAEQIVEKLNAIGVGIDPARIKMGDNHRGTVGRMHIARLVVQGGYAKTVQDAFNKFLNPGCPAYLPRQRVTCEKAIEVIHGSGGLAFLAHPGIGSLMQYFQSLARLPFDGLEAFHTKHSPGQTEQFIVLAKELGWLVSGGSDCHGNTKTTPEMGKIRVPYAYYEAICERLALTRVI